MKNQHTPSVEASPEQQAPQGSLGVAAGSRFRLLGSNDTIQIGDEFLSSDCVTWERVKGGPTIGEHWMIGCKFNPSFFAPHRRQISANNQLRNAGGGDASTTL